MIKRAQFPFHDCVLSRARPIAVMVSVFGDESADETEQRVFAVAALIGTQVQWDELKEAWIAKLDGREFHAAQWETEFANHSDRSKHKANQQDYKALTEIIVDSGVRGYGLALDLQAYNDVFPGIPADLPYYKCFTDVLTHIINRSREYQDAEPVQFTFDHRQKSEHNTGCLYDYMVNQPEWRERNIFLDTKIAFDSRKNACIQAADLFARETMKALDNVIGPVKRVMRKSAMALLTTEGRIAIDCYMREYFEGWKRAMPEIERRSGFSQMDYLRWLQSNRLTDNVSNRQRFVVWTDVNDGCYR